MIYFKQEPSMFRIFIGYDSRFQNRPMFWLIAFANIARFRSIFDIIKLDELGLNRDSRSVASDRVHISQRLLVPHLS